MKVHLIKEAPNPSGLLLPVFSSHVSAGFPSPADDYVEDKIDLNKHIVKRPAATFFARANGESLIDIGIKNGDLLVVDRSLPPIQGDVVIVAIDGEMTCKILDLKHQQLLTANKRCASIAITESMDLLIEGVVTHSVRYHRVRTG